MNASVLFSVFVLLFVSLRSGDVAEAVKCYVCKSSNMPNCQKSFFFDLGISQGSSCVCCMKSTSDSGTTSRECITGVDIYKCGLATGDSHACYSDLCNSSTRLQYNNNAAILALLSLASVSGFLFRY